MAEDAAVAPAGGTAAEYAASLEEPVLEIGGFRFVGRILSIEEWVLHWERRQALEDLTAKAIELKTPPNLRLWVEHWIAFLRDVFPRRRFRWWAPDPVQLMRHSEGLGLRGYYDSFFLHQAVALGAALPGPIPGPLSSASTADAGGG